MRPLDIAREVVPRRQLDLRHEQKHQRRDLAATVFERETIA